ncbi:MAG TPA: ferritin-like domain-containing protein [Alphaproteobacteria bacterium]|nr:ferritin-like domain-containing protein [Alphaproteobacteria bacterium]
MGAKKSRAEELSRHIATPPAGSEQAPSPEQILFDAPDPPPFPKDNVFPIEWHTDTPKLLKLYDASREQSWFPNKLAWDTLDPKAFTLDQRYAIAYWFGLLSVFDSSGPAVFARAMIHTYETHAEDPVRKCFFLITRDEVNHEEVCQRVIEILTPGGPLGFVPETALGKLAQNNVKWYFHNGARYWEGFKGGVHRHPLPILFTSFLMGEIASSTLFQQMHQKTTIPVIKDAFRRVGQDESRHLRICLTLLENVLPKLTPAQKETITKQIRAGYVFLSGILYEPPDQFWELPETWRPAHRLLEETARKAGLGILTNEERRENWRASLLRMKGVIEPFGIGFPAIPEIGISGETVAFDPADIVPVF